MKKFTGYRIDRLFGVRKAPGRKTKWEEKIKENLSFGWGEENDD